MTTIKDIYQLQQKILWKLQNEHTLDLYELKRLSLFIYNVSGNKNLHYNKLSNEGYLSQHSVNVAILSGYVARRLDIEVSKIKKVVLGSILHDTGKLFTVNNILDKPGKLDTLEKNVMKTHAFVGYNVIKEYIKDEVVEEIIRKHHTIPDEITEFDINSLSVGQIGAYICYVTDIVDAMLSLRCYKEVATAEETIADLKKRSVDEKIIEIIKTIILPS